MFLTLLNINNIIKLGFTKLLPMKMYWRHFSSIATEQKYISVYLPEILITLLLVCTWRHKILKSKLARPANFYHHHVKEHLKIYLFTVRYHLLCLKYSILNFRNCRPDRDIKIAVTKLFCLKKGLFLWFLAVWTVQVLGKAFMCIYTRPRGKSNRSPGKTELLDKFRKVTKFGGFSLLMKKSYKSPNKVNAGTNRVYVFAKHINIFC